MPKASPTSSYVDSGDRHRDSVGLDRHGEIDFDCELRRWHIVLNIDARACRSKSWPACTPAAWS